MEKEKTKVEKEISTNKKSVSGRFNWKQILAGFVLGAVLVLGIRYLTYSEPEGVHYHANFAVYVNGAREKFENPLYYEEVTSCDLESDTKPAHRVHMHDKANDVIHVHDGAVSWGNFFENIGWSIGDGFIDDSKKLHLTDSQNKVSYVLNGKTVSDVTGLAIGDKDKLLVSYGDTSKEDLMKQFDTVSASAAEFDTKQDPASCSGSNHDTKPIDRLKHLF